jgi:hypothetical protein
MSCLEIEIELKFSDILSTIRKEGYLLARRIFAGQRTKREKSMLN